MEHTSSGIRRERPLVAVSLKMYLDSAETHEWLRAVAEEVAERNATAAIDIVVFPSHVVLESSVDRLSGTGIELGAQDVSTEEIGPFTGEVSAQMIAQVGGRWAEVGHAERRARFGETDADVVRKVVSSVRAGLTPLVCIGEQVRGSVEDAAAVCLRQAAAVLEGLNDYAPDAPVAFAYEPVWAIGAAEPASVEYIAEVLRRFREALPNGRACSTVIYGGSARQGIYENIANVADGLFLGRFAHDPAAFGRVLDEVLCAPAVR